MSKKLTKNDVLVGARINQRTGEIVKEKLNVFENYMRSKYIFVE